MGFNWVGDISQANQWQSGSLQKVGLHAIMGGLAAEAAGGDFKTGALVAGANEALIDSLAQQYSGMEPDQRIGLLTMNSQVLGVLVASMAGGDEQDMQIGASVAGNATKYNWDLHLPQGLMEYGESATSMADYLQQQGASPEEVNQALRAMARGEGFEGPQPAQEFMKAWAMAMLTGGGVISHTAKGVTLVIGGAIGGGANITYQLSASDLEAISVTDASIATAVGALTQGRGLAGTVGVSMGGGYIGSQIKGTDASSAVAGAGTGAVVGRVGEKALSSRLNAYFPKSISNIFGAMFGGYFSSEVSATVEGGEKKNANWQ